MRVLIVNRGMNVYGGAELLIVRLANYLKKRGIKHALLTTHVPPEMEKDLTGTEIIIQLVKRSIIDKVIDKILGSPVSIAEILALHNGIKDNLRDFDVINLHNFPSELSVFLCKKPIVWMCNEPELYLMLELKSPYRTKFTLKALFRFEKFVVKNYIRYICVSDNFNRKRFEKIYGIRPQVINYGIDYEFFSFKDERKILKEFNLSDGFDNFIILHVGWLQPFKNQIESIKTVEKLKQKIPNIKLILTGFEEKEYKMMLLRYIKENGLEEEVIFTGHLDRKKIRDLYHACDVLLHPIKAQGGWLAPFEALCSKKPIVVSKEMTASDIIEQEKIGIVTENFAEAIWDIYNNKDKYDEMAERGKIWVEENLSWDRFCEKMVDIFYKAMGR